MLELNRPQPIKFLEMFSSRHRTPPHRTLDSSPNILRICISDCSHATSGSINSLNGVVSLVVSCFDFAGCFRGLLQPVEEHAVGQRATDALVKESHQSSHADPFRGGSVPGGSAGTLQSGFARGARLEVRQRNRRLFSLGVVRLSVPVPSAKAAVVLPQSGGVDLRSARGSKPCPSQALNPLS